MPMQWNTTQQEKGITDNMLTTWINLKIIMLGEGCQEKQFILYDSINIKS